MRVVCGLANKCGEASCPHRLPHDGNPLCAEPCDMYPERKGCVDFVEYLTGIKLKGGKNIEPYNGGLPVKIFRKEVREMAPTIGRIVHYRVNEQEVLPAIIVKVWGPDSVNLEVFGSAWNKYPSSVVQGDGVGEWQWPVNGGSPPAA